MQKEINKHRIDMRSKKAFTLIELLTVIAIIGILAGILIPTVSSVKTSANKAKTKAQFGQWSVAMGLFKNEYGYYPVIHTSNLIASAKFAGALTGRTLAGVKSATDGNTKSLSFYSIADNELNEAKTSLVDAFGNTEIAVFTDTTGDGVVNASDGAFVPVKGPETGDASATPDLPSGGVRAGVVFYSAGKGGSPTATVKANIVTSW